MGHEVYQKMVYSFEKPMWHVLAPPSLIPTSARGVLEGQFKGGFPIDVRPVYVKLNGKLHEKTKDFAIVRGAWTEDAEEEVFDYCSERYKPLQPGEIADCFDANVCEPAETMGFLRKGREMFISWTMPELEVIAGDVIKLYGIVKYGFDTFKGASLMTAIYRPICANTMAMAEGWAEHNGGKIWNSKGVNQNLLRDFGYWMEHVQGKALYEKELLQSFFGKLAHTPIKNDKEAWGILYDAYPDTESVSAMYPSQLRIAKEEKTLAFNESQAKVRDGIYAMFAGQGTAITPDCWGMFNSTTEFLNHYLPSKRPTASSMLFGGRNADAMKMVNVLSTWAG